MYLFVSGESNLRQFRDFASDFICAKNLKSLKSKIERYYKKVVPKDSQDELVFQKKYGAVLEKYNGDVIGWIVTPLVTI